MADFVFNIAKGAAAEKARDDATKFGVLLIKTAESDALMKDRATLTAVLSGSTEADFTNYARKTGITATLAVDNSGDVVTLVFADQTWTTAGGATNNTLAKLIIFYEEAAADGTRIPITAHDFVVTTDGTNIVADIPADYFYRAS